MGGRKPISLPKLQLREIRARAMRMDAPRKQQMRKALGILHPPPDKRARCEQLLREGFALVALTPVLIEVSRSPSDDEKKRLIRTLERIRHWPPSVAAKLPWGQLEALAGAPTRRAGHPTGHKQVAAVQYAAFLLERCERQIKTTRGGEWDQLALLLLDDPKIRTLQRHLGSKSWPAKFFLKSDPKFPSK
jgi:hypothetical protein